MKSDQVLSGVSPNNGLMVLHQSSIMRAKLFKMLVNDMFSSINEKRSKQAQAPVFLILDRLGSYDSEALREKWDRRNIDLVFPTLQSNKQVQPLNHLHC
jgi:hypothetical protein